MDCSLPGKNTGVGCHALLQELFLIQGLNPCLLHWQVDSLPPVPLAAAAAAAKLLQSCLTLCYPIDGSPTGSTIPGILQARTLEWVAISFSNAWKWKVKWCPLGSPKCSHGSLYFTLHHINQLSSKSVLCVFSAAAAAKLPQSCPTLCDPIEGSPLGSSVLGIIQARILEWVAIAFSNEWKWKVKVKSLSRARLLATPWTGAYQAPPSMGFSRQQYWSGVPLPSPLDYKPLKTGTVCVSSASESWVLTACAHSRC